MEYQELNLSRNGIVKILERDGETVMYQGKAKRAPSIEYDVISVDKVGDITEIVVACGKTKEEKAQAKAKRKSAAGKTKLVSSMALTYGWMLGSVGRWRW